MANVKPRICFNIIFDYALIKTSAEGDVAFVIQKMAVLTRKNILAFMRKGHIGNSSHTILLKLCRHPTEGLMLEISHAF